VYIAPEQGEIDMKYVKMLGLLAVAAAALMAFAGSASATEVTSPHGTRYTGVIKATSEGKTFLTGSFANVECNGSHVEGTITSQGSAVTASGPVNLLTFTECNFPTTVITNGSLIAHTDVPNEKGNALLTSKGAEVLVHTSVGTCTFATSNAGEGTPIGTLTGSTSTGKTATFDINSSKIPVIAGGFLCGSSGIWEGSYEVTTPDNLNVD
jgi:hypothetical protein